ncbi:GGDEF domain-containing protein [Vibrio sp. 99-8-1]|uniref:GGDEF domain-containing protein n=1 Tax=Vibrio sp. 99-8-1 TaxID=2607602 RepID=UPI0014934F39|nr:GGDEF domain-containing protein [Vibrio sp. 99-8-1]NOI67249.1 GGDEF domain-containing protein [Vibrio sp. 99-8-1]
MLRYKRQLMLILPLVVLNIYLAIFYPLIRPDNQIDLVIETSQMLVCFFLLFKIEEIKKSRQVYLFLFLSVSILTVGSALDFIDEFLDVSDNVGIAEDIFKSVGFVTFILACFRWVDFHKQQSQAMQHLAEVDSLTGLSNRRAFLNMSKSYFCLDEERKVSLLIIDVDYFKQVNDNFGHQFGDKLLIRIANAIKLSLRKGDYVARIGGEEFVVFLKNTDKQQAVEIAENICKAVEELILYCNNQKVNSSVSIGVVSNEHHSDDFEVLFSQADKLLYKAKSMGKNCCCSD